jgi:HSP20 family protein
MLATRSQPLGALWGDMDRFTRRMNRLLHPAGVDEEPEFTAPPVSVFEDAEKLYVEVDLPGLKLEDIKIEIREGNVLTIEGQRKLPEVPKGVWHRQERGFGKFARAVELPYPVEMGRVEAKFEQGVLFITLPQAEAAKPRRTLVKGG